MLPKNKPNAKRTCALLLMLPLAMLAACSTPSTPSTSVIADVPCPRSPMPPPSLMQRPARVDYSANAAADIQQWQQVLQSTLPK